MAERQHDIRQNQPKASRKPDKTEKPSSLPAVNDTIRLQSLIGNQAVQRLIAQGHTIMPGGTMVQAKLTVTSASNAYESEADSVAEQVVNRISSGESTQRAADEDELQMKRDPAVLQRAEEEELQMKRDPAVLQRADEEELQVMRDVSVLQRAEEEELQMKRDPAVLQRADEEELQVMRDVSVLQRAEEEELQMMRDPAVLQRADEDELQMMRDVSVLQRAEEEEMQLERGAASLADSFDVDSGVESQIKAEQGRGAPMSADLQRSMGDAFGADFSGVRVHTDSTSNELNAQVGARAFTTGSDVFFKEGEYKPDTAEGKKLLAHELTHTIQQNAVSRKAQGEE